MTQSGPVDYAKTYFLHQTLTKIQGEPDYSTLKILKKELKANASRVTSDLGGGARSPQTSSHRTRIYNDLCNNLCQTKSSRIVNNSAGYNQSRSNTFKPSSYKSS